MTHQTLTQWVAALICLAVLLLAPAASATRATQDAPVSADAPAVTAPAAPGPPASRPGIYFKDDSSFW